MTLNALLTLLEFCTIFMKKNLLFAIFQDEDDIGCFGRSDTSGPQHYGRSKVSGKPSQSKTCEHSSLFIIAMKLSQSHP